MNSLPRHQLLNKLDTCGGEALQACSGLLLEILLPSSVDADVLLGILELLLERVGGGEFGLGAAFVLAQAGALGHLLGHEIRFPGSVTSEVKGLLFNGNLVAGGDRVINLNNQLVLGVWKRRQSTRTTKKVVQTLAQLRRKEKKARRDTYVVAEDQVIAFLQVIEGDGSLVVVQGGGIEGGRGDQYYVNLSAMLSVNGVEVISDLLQESQVVLTEQFG